MRKAVILLMSLTLAFSLAGCGSSQQSGKAAGSAEEESTSAVEAASETSSVETTGLEDGTVKGDEAEVTDAGEAEEAETEAGAAAGKTLVVYYSATGNTEDAANVIAKVTNGDTFELEPAEAYSNADLNWRDDSSRVVYEHDNPEERDVALVADTVPDWESYNTVFVGYPIWWGIAAWPVDGFIEANDFTGKTVIPFCTSSSSGLGESGELLAESAGTGNWLEGIRFSSGASEETIQEWAESLRL